MATATGLTADEMRRLSNEEIISAEVDTNGNLILTTRGGLSTNVGRVRGDPGPMGPAGTVHMYAGSDAPAGWLVCDGSAVSRSDYPDLFSVIGITYGSGNGSTTFNLPNMKGRVGVGTDPDQAEFTPIGKKAGAKTHTHTLGAAFAKIALSSGYLRGLSVAVTSWTTNRYVPLSTTDSATDVSGGSALGGNTDGTQNLMPYMVMNYIIKVS